jgi:hypothetical protein
MRFFLLICLIFFSFILKAQQATFKIEKNDSEETVKLYSMYAKDSSTLIRNYNFQNVLFVNSNKDYQYIVYPSPEYRRFCRVMFYGQANMYNVDRITNHRINEIKFFVARIENNDTLFLSEYVMPVVRPTREIVLIGNKDLEYNFELDNYTPKNYFLTNRTLEIYNDILNYEYKVLSFDMRVIQSEKTYTSNSNMTTDEMLNVIMSLEPNQEIRFERVTYSYENKTSSTEISRVRIK